MKEPLRAKAGELSAEEILGALDEGRRVMIETEVFGSTYEVTLRKEKDVYYCDTPTTLHKHRSEDEMRTCIENHGYIKDIKEKEQSG